MENLFREFGDCPGVLGLGLGLSLGLSLGMDPFLGLGYRNGETWQMYR